MDLSSSSTGPFSLLWKVMASEKAGDHCWQLTHLWDQLSMATTWWTTGECFPRGRLQRPMVSKSWQRPTGHGCWTVARAQWLCGFWSDAPHTAESNGSTQLFPCEKAASEMLSLTLLHKPLSLQRALAGMQTLFPTLIVGGGKYTSKTNTTHFWWEGVTDLRRTLRYVRQRSLEKKIVPFRWLG